MSTPHEREAALRRALLSAAEHIEPAPGGLERIQARLRRPRPAAVAWLEAAWTVVVMRAPDVIEAVRRRAANVLHLVWERFGPRSATGPGQQRLSWLRPLVAMSVAVFVLGAGFYVAFQSALLPVFPAGVSAGALGGGGSHSVGPAQGGRGTTDGHGSQSPYSSATSSAGGSQACSPSPTPYNSGHPSTGPTIRPPSPTSTSSQSTSPATSPSPSASGSSNSGGSTPPSSGGSVATPNAGLASGIPASAGGEAATGTGANQRTTNSMRRSANPTQSAAPSHAATGSNRPSNKYKPCQTTKSKAKHKKKASTTQLTSAQHAGAKVAQNQPGRVVTAKLD